MHYKLSASTWRTIRPLLLLLAFFSTGLATAAEQTQLTGPAAKLYQQAQDTGHWFAGAARLNPEIRPTSDGKSFFVVWKSSKSPKRWIVSLHGAGRPAKGFATDDLAIWHPHLKDRDVGLVCLQWWLGKGDGPEDFYTPQEIYREIDLALQQLGVQPGTVMLHGFSRGSANSYAVAAIDAGRGKHYFSLAVASSGGMSPDYPPNRGILNGDYGDHPLKGTRWITVAGGRDPHPERDGIAGMRRTASWLREQGAVVVESIEDQDAGHGALHLHPKNARRVLDSFLK
jgi:predicted esterase